MDRREPENYHPYEDSQVSKVQGKLLQYYDRMREGQLQSEQDKQTIQELVSDISHQVKTPIANIQIDVECDSSVTVKTDIANLKSHGTAVLSNILYECNRPEILAIEILDINNKGKIYELVKAIEFCIRKKVSLINISLGIVTGNEVILQALKTVCLQAVKQGIIIVAASNNDCMKQSYPAAFDFVVSVSSSNKIHRYCEIDSAKNDICFCFQTCLSKYGGSFDIYSGNSYLCGYVSGLICTGIEEVCDANSAVGLLKQFFMSDLTPKLFMDPNYDAPLELKMKSEKALENQDVLTSALLEEFDEEIEGYDSCGESDASYRCKKDCVLLHNAVFSAVN